MIGDGGDFVSFAGKFVEPKRPGGWLDPGPYGCLGAGMGAAIAARLAPPLGAGRAALRRRRGGHVADGRRHPGAPRPAGGDGLRQQLRLGAGEGPDADALRLRRRRRPGAGARATTRWSTPWAVPARRSPTRSQIGPALDRAFAANVPYMVNVITDVEAAYPRATFGI